MSGAGAGGFTPRTPVGYLGTEEDQGPSRSLQHQRHDLGAVEHVLHADPFVGLVGEVQQAGTVGDAVVQPADAVDVLLVVGAGRDDIVGLPGQHPLDGGGGGADHRGVAVGHHRVHLEQVADLVAEGRARGLAPAPAGR